MASVFWDAHGVLFIDYLEEGKTINCERYISFSRRVPIIIIVFLNSQIRISLDCFSSCFDWKSTLNCLCKCNYLSISKIVCFALDNLSKKLQLKFQVNPTKIERVTMYANLKNIVLRKTRLKFQNAFTVWNIQNIDLIIFLPLLWYPSII